MSLFGLKEGCGFMTDQEIYKTGTPYIEYRSVLRNLSRGCFIFFFYQLGPNSLETIDITDPGGAQPPQPF